MAADGFGERPGFWRTSGQFGESIAQRSRRSQRGNLGMAADSFGEHQGFLGEHQGNSGKASHRDHGGHRGGIEGGRLPPGLNSFGRPRKQRFSGLLSQETV